MFNRNEAPEGYEAVKYSQDKGNTCSSCAFDRLSDCSFAHCTIESREDRTNVIFVKKQENTNVAMMETGLLVNADINDLKQNECVLDKDGKSWIYLDKSKDRVVCRSITSGEFVIFNHSDIFKVPLFWLDKCPVYMGDTIYYKNDGMTMVVHKLDVDTGKVVVKTEDYGLCSEELSDLSYYPPKKSVKKTGWINIYPDGRVGGIHETRELADASAGGSREDCIEIEWNAV